MWDELLTALALVMVLEGLWPFISPDGFRRAMLMMSQIDPQQLRWSGLISMVLGVFTLYLVH